MKEYAIGFRNRGAMIFDSGESKPAATVSYPELKSEIDLPVRYTVSSLDDRLLGTISSYLPERNRIEMTNGGDISTLIVESNEDLILRVSGTKFDVGRVELEDLSDDERKGVEESLKRTGDVTFSHGYKLRSAAETARLYFFTHKSGDTRAQLLSEGDQYLPFLPVVVYERIKKDLEGRTLRKKVPVVKPQRIRREFKEGEFTKFVQKKFTPRILEGAFSYQDQGGEKDRFFEYLDNGLRPIILNGPTGNGKSVLAEDYASSRGIPFYFDKGGVSFRVYKTIGAFVPGVDRPFFSPGPLTLAMIFGGLYALEEGAQVPQDEFTELNRTLETGELPLMTHLGFETVYAHPRFRFVVLGNFHSQYTTNEWNDAILQRFTQLKIGYPSKENTIDIIQARAPGLNYDKAELISKALVEMRQEAGKFSKDVGLKGAVELAQRLVMGTDISMKDLFLDNVVNPLTTYENHITTGAGKLYKKLSDIVDKYV